MARRTFFSFHYKPDVSRAHVVRNSWVTHKDRESAGFFDSSVFESKQRDDTVLKQFLSSALDGTSVTCVLVGGETYSRPWVQFELVRSFYAGNGLLAIDISGVKDLRGIPAVQGPNPFDYLAFAVTNGTVSWKRKVGTTWYPYTIVPNLSVGSVCYNLGGKTNHTFSTLFPTYSWNTDNGYQNIGRWIEAAAVQAGR